MRCPICADVLPDSVWGVQSHYRLRHGVRWHVPAAALRRAPAADLTVTAHRRPAAAPKRRPQHGRWHPAWQKDEG